MEAWTKELAILLLVFIRVGCCGCPMASRTLQSPITVWLLLNSAPHSASAAEQTTCLSAQHSMRMGRCAAFCCS
eukprot:6566272-Ditylum_brightwellii.AAC.1